MIDEERTALLGDVHAQPRPGTEARKLPALREYGKAVLASHTSALSLFCSREFRVPMLVVWFTALGGAMHDPAVPFFYLSLGLSAAQIGQAGGILTTGSLLLAPVYGRIFDKCSAQVAMVLAISLCGGGCLLRALATGPSTVLLSAVVMSVDGSFESLVLAYVARDQPIMESSFGGRQRPHVTKAEVISAFLVQAQVMRIIGRGLYPAWNWSVRQLLPAEHSVSPGSVEEPGAGVGSSQLLRYRIVLASCVVPCVLGFLALLWLCCTSTREAAPGQKPMVVSVPMQVVAHVSQRSENSRVESAVDTHTDDAKKQTSEGYPKHSTSIIVALGAALVAQGAVMALMNTLWPLFLRVHYDVDDDGFAPLLLSSSLAAATAIVLAPSFATRMQGGALSVATISACSAGLSTPAAFAVQCPRSSLPTHTLLVIVSFASVALLDTSLKSAASELATRSCQGSAFGLVASLSGIGSVCANIFGTVLYEHSFAEHSELGESESHSVLQHGATLSRLNSTHTGNVRDEWWCEQDERGHWDASLSVERIVAGLGGLLPFHVVGILLLMAGSGLALAR